MRLIDPEVSGFAVFAGFVSGYLLLDTTGSTTLANGSKLNTANTANLVDYGLFVWPHQGKVMYKIFIFDTFFILNALHDVLSRNILISICINNLPKAVGKRVERYRYNCY